MKVYVDELPKDCIDCPCESEYYCNLLNEDVGCCEWGEIHKNCPLQPLADYTKQVKKEVCNGLALPLIKHFQKDAEFTVEEICKWIEEYKNQTQGETKNAETK